MSQQSWKSFRHNDKREEKLMVLHPVRALCEMGGRRETISVLWAWIVLPESVRYPSDTTEQYDPSINED
jgi:hypothetical protein